MRTEEAVGILQSLSPVQPGVTCTVGRRRDAAYLRMERTSEPFRWAVVSSPGDRWFAFDVDGGFSLNHFEEDTPDSEVCRMLAEYADLAAVYLADGGTVTRAGWLRPVVLTVAVPAGSVVLRRSLARELLSVFRIGGGR